MREVKKPKDPLFKQISEKLDSFIGVFSPEMEHRRRMYRIANTFALSGGYSGGKSDRVRESWIAGGGSADEDLLPDLQALREKSRDLNRNDSVASGVTATMITNIIGSGIIPQSYIDGDALGMSEDAVDKFQQQAERIWERWEPHADAGNRQAFWEIQHLVQRQILENGEVIIIPEMIEEPGRPYFLALNTIECDRLDTPSDKRSEKNIRRGVEIGPHGEPLAYWICNTHPGDITYRKRTPEAKDYIRYEARNKYGRPNVMHIYWTKRPGQTRGEPFFAPVVNRFKDLGDYMEAELIGAKVAACFAVFIKKANALDAAIGRASKTDAPGKRIETLEPGIIEYLRPGEEMQAFNPQRPGAQFDPFVEKVLRFIGVGLGLPYELIFKDFSKTNYSSARAAILEARKFFIYQQNWMAQRLCQPVWNMLMDEAFLRNELQAKDYFNRREDYVKAKWVAPGWSYIDPETEVNAAAEAIKNNISTLSDECAAHGKDWQDTMYQRAREEKLRKALNLPDPESQPAPAAAASGKNKPKETRDGQKN